MKRLLVALLLTLFITSMAWADQRSVGNTADAAITAGAGYLSGIIVHTDASNSCTFDIYDHATAASGNKLLSTWTVTTSATNRTTTLSFDDEECIYVNGIYIDITVSGQGSVTYDVYFKSY